MKYLLYLSILILAGYLFSCSKADPTAETRQYVIKVDSIQLPDTVASGHRFDIKFFGTIGINGCYSFADFVVSEDSTGLSLMLKGNKKVSANQACPDVLVLLGGMTYSHKFAAAGQYRIRVTNPGIGQFIQKEILVVAP
ncbi:MAG: hypothetical protein K8F24_12690 [Bacteroidales bacterium]|nr:hypothetical protein [Bacteroidales bacterium]